MKKVGILGSGVVGKTLAAGFHRHGYRVALGTGHPDNIRDWSADNPDIHIKSFPEAAAFGDALVLAVKGLAAEQVLSHVGAETLGSKLVMDATNPIADAPPEDGVLRFFTQQNRSLMEDLQFEYPKARFVKVFNSVASINMVDPKFEQGQPTMFICGDDDEARSEVTKVLHAFGWEVEDMGSAKAARAIEPLCMLFCIPGLREDRWTHAFKLFKK